VQCGNDTAKAIFIDAEHPANYAWCVVKRSLRFGISFPLPTSRPGKALLSVKGAYFFTWPGVIEIVERAASK
jgi:hypothetical protein